MNYLYFPTQEEPGLYLSFLYFYKKSNSKYTFFHFILFLTKCYLSEPYYWNDVRQGFTLYLVISIYNEKIYLNPILLTVQIIGKGAAIYPEQHK